MPSSASNVGAQSIPLKAGAANSALSDPVLSGLLDYFGHWLNYALNPQLSQMAGTSAEAVPVANRFPYDPQTVFVRQAFPALYAWNTSFAFRHTTLMRRARARTVRVLWVFNELVSPLGVSARSGLYSAADGALSRACYSGRHRDYGHNGAPNGTPITRSLELSRFNYQGSEPMMLWQIPGADDFDSNRVDTRESGSIQRGFPAISATFTCDEEVSGDSYTEDDLLPDVSVTIETGDTTQDTTPFRHVVLPAPDGWTT